jgi:hypothetical protein
LQAVVFVFPLHVVVFPFSANNNNTSNNNTPPPKPGTPSSNEGNNLTELKPVQPTPQSYTPLPSFTGQFSSKHDFIDFILSIFTFFSFYHTLHYQIST